MVSKVFKIIKVLIWPIIFLFGQLFIYGIFMFNYMHQNSHIDWNDKGNNGILMEYMNNQTLLIVLVGALIFIPLFYCIYKKYYTDKVICSIKSFVKICCISFLISIFLNLIIIYIKSILNIVINDNSINFAVIVSTGIIGPVIEELLFRGIVYGGFTKIFKEKTAFYSSILVFAFFHSGIFQILFAFIVGYFLTVIYKRYHDIRISMIAHIIVNTTSILMSPFILSLF